MHSAAAAMERLCDPEAEVSAHYLIGRTGMLWQLVDEEARAWHAGAGSWRGQGDVNSRSIGIELDNGGDHPFGAAQMAMLERLLGAVMERWAIPPEGVIAHSDMAPERKSDPGARFDWARLARQGLAVWPLPGQALAPDWARFREWTRAIGYTADVGDDDLLAAFRLRFRPWGQGALAGDDMARARDLGQRYGANRHS